MAAPGGWAHFRKVWIKPEVYPLIGSMVVALGVCSAALINKISQPGMVFSKSARAGGILAQLDGIDEVKPMWSGSKRYSMSIFDRSYDIVENNLTAPAPVRAEAVAEAKEDVLEILSEAPEVSKVAGDVVEAVKETVEAAVEHIAEAVEEAKEKAQVADVEAVVENVVKEVKEDIMEKGAEVAAELKKILPEPPSATA